MGIHPLFAACVVATAALAQAPGEVVARDGLATAVVRRHADHCFRMHVECLRRAAGMREKVEALLASPSAERLDAARAAWCRAREAYGQIEVLRFHGGPIDAVEPLLNAWPVDEAYIDYVVGKPQSGIVHDDRTWRTLSAELLEHANEQGSETNVSVGWHAIEFLLWGQDLDAAGPGSRPCSDFAPGDDPAVERRRTYLAVITRSLVQHLDALVAQWAPDADNFRRRFEADPQDALRRMLTGAAVLTAFELAGERLAVAYETQDQEQEHSCFSDTTCQDLIANQRGIVAVFDGGRGAGDATLLALLRSRDAALAAHLERTLADTLAAVRAIPHPFDQAFLGADDAPGRRAILLAIEALEQQAEAIAIAGRLLGHELPMHPGN